MIEKFVSISKDNISLIDGRDLEKMLTRIEDILPQLAQKVDRISKYAESFQKALASPIKISRKHLEPRIVKLQESNSLLQTIGDLIIRLDQYFKDEPKPKRLTKAKKTLQKLSINLEKSNKEIKRGLGGLAKRKVPKGLREFGIDIFKPLKKLLEGKKEVGYDMSMRGNEIYFSYYLKVTGKIGESRIKRTFYVVLSQDFNQSTSLLSPRRLRIFKNVLPDLPYMGDAYYPKNLVITIETALTMISALGFSSFLKKLPRKSLYKPVKTIVRRLEKKYLMVRVKTNAVYIAVKKSDITHRGKIKEEKTYPIILDAKRVFRADRRKLGFLTDMTSGKKGMMIFRFRFFPRDVLKYIR